MVFLDIIEEHAEEASFLWLLRCAAVKAPHYNLAALADLDDRLEAHLDGLRIAGQAGWEICKEALRQNEAGGVFAASVLAFEMGDGARIEVVLRAGSAAPELSCGLASALSWLPYPQVREHIQKLLERESPVFRWMGISASTGHRQDPGEPLVNAIFEGEPRLRARALRAVGELGRVDLVPHLQSELLSGEETSRFAAAWSAALLGDPGGVGALKSLAGHPSSYREEAAAMALRRLDLPACHVWQEELARNPDSMRLAVIAAGIMGDSSLIPWLVDRMKIPALARAAGESFTWITGEDLPLAQLEGKAPEGPGAGPPDNPLDEDAGRDPDENLPWPDQALIEKWWNQNRGRFKNGTRYLLGQPVSFEHLQRVLRTGRQRQRAAAALELAMIKPGQPLFEVRAPGSRQQQLLGIE